MSTPIGAFLCPPGFAGPKGWLALSREATVALEAARGARRRRTDRRARGRLPYARADRRRGAEPVLLVPGFMAGDWSLAHLSGFLREHGHRCYRSGILVNMGCTQRVGEQLEQRLESIAIRRQSTVTIVGHSLGGMLARGLAARRPDLVAGIVTLGSPVLAPGAVHGLLAWNTELLTRLSRAGFDRMMSDDCVAGACARLSWESTQAALDPAIGYTAIYSKRDGVVDWRGALDPSAQHVEVRCSHVGMALDPLVFDQVLAAISSHRSGRAAAPVGAESTSARRRSSA